MAKDKRIDLDDASPNMVLADAILDGHGDVLLPVGTVLTESTLTSLRRRGIDTIVVVNNDISPEELAAERERLQQRLSRLFRHSITNAENKRLLQHMTTYRLG